jgi:hypothetical protein
LLPKANRVAPTINHLWVDKGYTGQALATAPSQTDVT